MLSSTWQKWHGGSRLCGHTTACKPASQSDPQSYERFIFLPCSLIHRPTGHYGFAMCSPGRTAHAAALEAASSDHLARL